MNEQKAFDIVYQYILENYGAELDLTLCPPIKIVKKESLPRDVFARIEPDALLVSREIISDCINAVSDLKEYLQIVSVTSLKPCIKQFAHDLFHELCHVDAKSKMRKLHEFMMNDKTRFIDSIVVHYWIEFCTQVKSMKAICKDDVFSQSFVDYSWNVQYLKTNRNDNKDMFWLIYSSPYFISHTFVNGTFPFFLDQIIDGRLKKYCSMLYNQTIKLYHEMPFDNYEIIKPLLDVFVWYFPETIKMASQFD